MLCTANQPFGVERRCSSNTAGSSQPGIRTGTFALRCPNLRSPTAKMRMPSCTSLAMQSSYMGMRVPWTGGGRVRRNRNSGGVWLPTHIARRQVTQASFFGVGAPEALLVGVVALVVFGPKGLAEAVKALGNTLRTFQPTIREIATVSSDLRNTLEEQIGLDEIRQEFRSATAPVPRTKPVFTDMPAEDRSSTATQADSTTPKTDVSLQEVRESFERDLDPDIARKRAESAAAAWGSNGSGSVPAKESQQPHQSAPAQATVQKPLTAMSVEELEAELARRKAAGSEGRSA